MTTTEDDGFDESASIFGSTMSLASSGSGGSSETLTETGPKGKKVKHMICYKHDINMTWQKHEMN